MWCEKRISLTCYNHLGIAQCEPGFRSGVLYVRLKMNHLNLVVALTAVWFLGGGRRLIIVRLRPSILISVTLYNTI